MEEGWREGCEPPFRISQVPCRGRAVFLWFHGPRKEQWGEGTTGLSADEPENLVPVRLDCRGLAVVEGRE